MSIEINKFDEGSNPSSWTTSTPLDGEEMQKSLDMLLSNDVSLRNGMTSVSVNTYGTSYSLKNIELVTNSGKYGSEYYNLLGTYTTTDDDGNSVDVEVDLGNTIPSVTATTTSDTLSKYSTLCCDLNSDGDNSLYWAHTNHSWVNVKSVNAISSRNFTSSNTRILLSTFIVPSEDGTLPSDDFILRIQGRLTINLSGSGGTSYQGPTYSPFGLFLDYEYGTQAETFINLPWYINTWTVTTTATLSDGTTSTSKETKYGLALGDVCYASIDISIPKSRLVTQYVNLYLGFYESAPLDLTISTEATQLLLTTTLV